MNGLNYKNQTMAFYMYILRCNDGSYYTGHTDNIECRISEHEQKKYDSYTSTRLPIQVAFIEEFGTRDEALAAERQVKGWNRKKKEALIARDWDKLRQVIRLQKNKVNA